MTTFTFRPNTLDFAIFCMVYLNNEYNLPPRFDATDLIIDVGTHIGSFAFAALVRGAGKVICAEAHPDNIERARRHLADYITVGKVDLRHGAVWRSDVHQLVTVSDFPVHDSQLINTGGVTTYPADLPPYLEIIPLDDLISNAHIRLLKLDCEGAEFPILLTSHRLRQVQEIVGEYHEHEVYTMTLLEQHLLKQGFQVTHQRHRAYVDGQWTLLARGYFRAVQVDAL